MISALHNIGMTDGMITSSIITIVLSILAIVAGRHLRIVPSGLQNAVEMAVEGLLNFFSDIMGRKLARQYLPLVGTLFIYILCCNYSGLLPGAGEINGLSAPTNSINCTAAMAIEMLVRPLSLSLRLYGNVLGEETATHVFFQLIPIGVPVIMQALSILMGLIQALVFSLLTAIYLSEACETEELTEHE